MRTALSKFASTGSASTSQEVAPLLTLGDAQTSIFRPPLGTAAPTSSPPKRIWFAAALAGFMLVSSVLLAALYANRPTTTEVAVVPGAWTTPEPTNAATVATTPTPAPTVAQPDIPQAPTAPVEPATTQRDLPTKRVAARTPRRERTPTWSDDDPTAVLDSPARRPEPSRDELRAVKRALEPLIAGCGTGANESAVAQFSISSTTGRVASLEVTGLARAASRQCVERTIQRQVHFNAFDGAALQLAWRFDVP